MLIRILIAVLAAAAALPAQTAAAPPMGWNSYDYYNWTVNEAETMSNARSSRARSAIGSIRTASRSSA